MPDLATGAAPAPPMSVAQLRRRFCPVCREVRSRAFLPGPGGRPHAKCPSCGSLERQRFLALLLPIVALRLGEVDTLLDVGPSSVVTPLLLSLKPRLYVRMDIGYASREVDVLSSLTQLPHPDASIDLLVCYHVLEHIPDDGAAMREIARVLKPGGIALIQVPIRLAAEVTDEDPDAPPAERLRRFGQTDHVRYYGRDFPDRLMAAGLSHHRTTPLDLLGPSVSEWCRLSPRETVWIAQRASVPAGSGGVPPGADPTALTALLDAALNELVRSRGQIRRLRRQRSALRAGPARTPARYSARRLLGAARRLM